MARSSYIYVVQDGVSEHPLGAFTVKHELITWLSKRRAVAVLEDWFVAVYVDGPGQSGKPTGFWPVIGLMR